MANNIERRKNTRRNNERRGNDRREFDRGTGDRRKLERRKFDRRENYKADTERKKFSPNNFNAENTTKKHIENEKENFEDIFSDQIEGRNAVIELIESGKDINKLYIAKGDRTGSINKIIAMAKERKIVIVEKDKQQMENMAQTVNYQGVIAIVPPYEYCEIEDILDFAKQKNESPFVLILDGIEDTHNLGAIIRTAETAGVHGIVIPKRRSALVNSTVSKVACGAVEYMKIARVNNINDSIKKLKDAGLWICGTAVDAEEYYFNHNLTGPIGIVIGNEGKGMSDLVKKNCDFLVKIPVRGHVQSLNASVSTGIIVYEAVKQRVL